MRRFHTFTRFTRCAGIGLLMACALLPAGAAWAAKDRAEYSLRWDPSQGGPATAEGTLAALKLKADEHSRFEVQYFDIDTPASAPPGYAAIMRKRTVGTKAQLTYKLRGSVPWPGSTSLKHWDCPLPRPHDRKEETDIAFLASDQVSQAWSRSCSHSTAQLDVAVPAALQPRPNSCTSTMTRLEAGKLKIEEWQLADGGRLIEVSRLGRDSDKERTQFRDQVVEALIALRVRPIQRSKSALGGECS